MAFVPKNNASETRYNAADKTPRRSGSLARDQHRPDIVVGIDFGTTHSGVSWAVNAGERLIHLIDDWRYPADTYSNRNSHKTPSLISYDHDDKPRWGFEADREKSPKWFKIALDPDHEHAKALPKVADEIGRSNNNIEAAEAAATAYLQNVWSFAQGHIRRFKGNSWRKLYNTRVVLSVPAMWNQAARERLKRVAEAAGLPSTVAVVAEPEAAALAVFKDRRNAGTMFEEGDVFVVCDAGGGTADLISYTVLRPEPLAVQECVAGTGGLCGAAFIDVAFENYVRTIVGEGEYSQLRVCDRAKMMEDFDLMIKRSFEGSDREVTVALPGVKDNADVGISGGRIHMSGAALRTLFDPVCDQVVELVVNQITDVQRTGKKVKEILLVGGFGANKYLHQRIETDRRIREANIDVVQTKDSWSSICRGATLWGLEYSERQQKRGVPTTVQSRLARYSYGIQVHADESDDSDVSSPERENRMLWLVKRGNRMDEGSRRDHEIKRMVGIGTAGWIHLFSNSKSSFTHDLWYCQRDPPPKYFNPHVVNRLCTITHQIRKGSIIRHARGGEVRQVSFTLGVEMGSASLDFFVIYNNGKNKEVGRCNAQYKEVG